MAVLGISKSAGRIRRGGIARDGIKPRPRATGFIRAGTLNGCTNYPRTESALFTRKTDTRAYKWHRIIAKISRPGCTVAMQPLRPLVISGAQLERLTATRASPGRTAAMQPLRPSVISRAQLRAAHRAQERARDARQPLSRSDLWLSSERSSERLTEPGAAQDARQPCSRSDLR